MPFGELLVKELFENQIDLANRFVSTDLVMVELIYRHQIGDMILDTCNGKEQPISTIGT